MRVRPEVIHELRALFKTGATPSRLISHIAERHRAEPALHALIQEYFWEAFAVPLVRGLKCPDAYGPVDLRYAFLNEQLVHDLIEKRPEWDTGTEGGANGHASWLDPFVATSDLERLRQAQAMTFPELAASWKHLTAVEQAFIQRCVASANGLYETVKILAQLAERLQQRIVALESQAAAKQAPTEDASKECA